MPWVRLDDAFYDNAKFAELSNAAVGAWAKLLAFSNRNLSDGCVTTVFALRLAKRKELAELVSTGLLEPTDTGWKLHDFLDYQPSAKTVREQQEQRSAAGRLGGIAKANAWRTASDLPDRLPENGLANGLANAWQKSAPTPTPKQKEKKTCATNVAREPDRFAAFWAAYPRKLGKPEAQRAWTRALRKASADVIIASLPAWCVSWTDPRYIPHPSTWLNREQWNDAPVTSTNGAKPKRVITDENPERAAWARSVAQSLGEDVE